jgi:tetratricopeptide (TPR) repeat protein
MTNERRPKSLLLITLCGLLFLAPPPAWGDGSDPSFAVTSIGEQEQPGNSGKGLSFTTLEPLSEAWREAYVKTYLSGYLFREDVSFSPYDEDGEEDGDPVHAGEIDCGRRCRAGEQNLAAGFLPEALAEYMTAAEKGCPYMVQGCRPTVGILKADLAMGRFSEATRLFLRLSRKHDVEEDKLFTLIGGILAAFDQDFNQALERFEEAGTNWHLVPNVEGIAGYVLFRKHRYEDARNVFRVVMHSPWAGVRDFGVLGLADCSLALGGWVEAEPLYESLAEDKSPLGWLGLAEFNIRQGKIIEARKHLNMLVSSSDRDYWKGVGLAYLMFLRSQPEEWAESIQLAERARGLVLPPYWTAVVREKTVEAMEGGIESLWQGKAHEELLILAEEWRSHQADLSKKVQFLIGKAYEQAGLKNAALQVYSRLSSDPDALFQGARLAWRCEKYDEAQALLEKYLDSTGPEHRNDAKLLLACVYARQNRLDQAKEALRGMGRIEDPSMLIALGSVEASMGMRDLAIDHLQTGLAGNVISDEERQHILYLLGELNYQQVRFQEALRCFRLAGQGEGVEQAISTEPMEVLCLARIDRLGEARTLLGNTPKDQETDLVKEILDAEDLFRSLRREGYGF